MKKSELKDFLNEKADQYNTTDFIALDPISVPHCFENKADIETIGFIIATISWGKRELILKSGERLMQIMGNSPFEFVMQASEEDLADLKFVHRTFNAEDLSFFIRSLRNIYQTFPERGLEAAFEKGETMAERISNFRSIFLTVPHELRSTKHISNPLKGSAAKRINMFLRWMVRKDKKGVDFGLWSSISPAELYLPLDVHTGNIARKLGLIQRKANDWKALDELMPTLRKFDPDDPCKYDFALFGLGIYNDL